MKVYTIKEISFREYNIPAGTFLYIDVSRMVAFHKGIHFDIMRDEYTVVNQLDGPVTNYILRAGLWSVMRFNSF